MVLETVIHQTLEDPLWWILSLLSFIPTRFTSPVRSSVPTETQELLFSPFWRASSIVNFSSNIYTRFVSSVVFSSHPYVCFPRRYHSLNRTVLSSLHPVSTLRSRSDLLGRLLRPKVGLPSPLDHYTNVVSTLYETKRKFFLEKPLYILHMTRPLWFPLSGPYSDDAIRSVHRHFVQRQ